mmetsp:Transcript_46195/g.148848  ORF Transcript_46195/g.148848 Transcript_46195/m.148848 type:complete len:442 (+) Transcript_46195:2672-3997(+)
MRRQHLEAVLALLRVAAAREGDSLERLADGARRRRPQVWARDVDAVVGEDGGGGARQRRHLEIDRQPVERGRQLRGGAGECGRGGAAVREPARPCKELEQLASHRLASLGERTEHHDGHLCVREGERGVRGAQRLGALLPLHHQRDLPLRRALRDGADVDARRGHRLCEGCAGARPEGHPLADDGHDRLVLFDRDARDLDVFRRVELAEELCAHRLERAVGVGLLDAEADGGVGGRLRDHQHGHALAVQHGEEARRHLDRRHQAGALHVEDGDRVDGGDSLDRRGVVAERDGARGLAQLLARGLHLARPAKRRGLERAGAAGDDGARVGRVEYVAHVDGDVGLDAGRHGGRVQHLRAEVGELDRLVILERVDREGLGHAARVRRVHAVDVLPHRDPRRAHQLREDCGRVVGPRPLECGGHAVGRGGDEASHNDHWRGGSQV